MWAMGQALGVEFGRETRAAWESLLGTISAVMLEAAAAAAPRSCLVALLAMRRVRPTNELNHAD
jgi:hypothetical protein